MEMAEKLNITVPAREFDDYNMDEARGWIIERLNLVELWMSKKIADYFKPENRDNFEKVLLNSLVVGIGAKNKILISLGLIDKKTFEEIQSVLRIRNAFAHMIADVKLGVQIESPEHIPVFNISHTLDIMNSNGKITTHTAKSLFETFRVDFSYIRKSFRAEE